LIDAQSGSTDYNARDIIRRWLEAPDALWKFGASVIHLIVDAKADGHEYQYCD